jgi:hypothetical protein
MATAVDRRDVARARRTRVGAWLVVAAVAIALVVLGLTQAAPPRSPTGRDPADWRGRTAQGLAVAATINGRWLDGLGVRLRLSCDSGARAETFVWTPSPDLYAQDGDRLTAAQGPRRLPATGGWRRSYEGRLALQVGDRPHGTASVRVTWARGATRVVCGSGPVTFSLARAKT